MQDIVFDLQNYDEIADETMGIAKIGDLDFDMNEIEKMSKTYDIGEL